jgi:hypothetical protein
MAEDSFVPPKTVQAIAARALEMRREYGRGGLTTQEAGKGGIGSGVARASTLSAGKGVSLDTAKRMVAYFSRHAKDKDAEGFRQGEKGYPSAGRVAWDLWGGDAGKTWAEGVVKKAEAEREAALKRSKGE